MKNYSINGWSFYAEFETTIVYKKQGNINSVFFAKHGSFERWSNLAFKKGDWFVRIGSGKDKLAYCKIFDNPTAAIMYAELME